MISHLKPYSEYKHSSCKWIGMLPEHWDFKRISSVSEMRVSNVDKHSIEGESPVRLCNYVDVYKNDVIHADMSFMKATATNDEIKRFRLERGDVLLTKDSETWNDIGVPALVSSTAPDLISGYHLAILRPQESILGGFLFRALQSKELAYQFHTEAKGVTRHGLSHRSIRSAQLPIPSVSEQHSIIRYLNYIDRRIQKYIRAKKKLIKLLEEQKQAIINQAVTKGLNPDVKMRPSGIEWLGEIPEHWRAIRTKHVALISRGKFSHRPRNDPSLYGGAYPFIQTGDVSRAGMFVSSFSQTLNEAGLAVSRICPKGTLLMTIAANIGDVAIIDFDACFPDSIVGFMPRSFVERDFLFFAFSAMKRELLADAPVNTQGNLNVERIGVKRLAVPPLDEQRMINHDIAKRLSEIQTLIDGYRKETALSSEYRTRLISDVVTGKVDVRQIAAQLPEDDEDHELPELDDALDEVIEEMENEVEEEE